MVQHSSIAQSASISLSFATGSSSPITIRYERNYAETRAAEATRNLLAKTKELAIRNLRLRDIAEECSRVRRVMSAETQYTVNFASWSFAATLMRLFPRKGRLESGRLHRNDRFLERGRLSNCDPQGSDPKSVSHLQETGSPVVDVSVCCLSECPMDDGFAHYVKNNIPVFCCQDFRGAISLLN
jgi:hypothetical protein